jgi:hypothetical protein
MAVVMMVSGLRRTWRKDRWLGGNVVPVHPGGASVGFEQRGQDLHHGGFAGAVGAEQGKDGARGDAQIDAPQYRLVTVRLGEPDNFDCCDRGHGSIVDA